MMHAIRIKPVFMKKDAYRLIPVRISAKILRKSTVGQIKALVIQSKVMMKIPLWEGGSGKGTDIETISCLPLKCKTVKQSVYP
jgi:hypothetical protein